MKALMVYPNRYRPHVMPVGIEYVCNSLLHAGIPFEVADLNFESVEDVCSRIIQNKPDLVGISIRNVDACYLRQNEFFIPQIRDLVHRIKSVHSCRVVLGGAGYSLFPSEILEYTGADFGVAGFGEKALPELISALEGGKDLAGVNNLVWRNDQTVVLNPRSKLGYEELPPRRRNIMRNRDYYRAYGFGNIEARRGCHKPCGYCAEPEIVGRDVLTRSIDHVLAELRELREMGMSFVHFSDSEFNVGSPRFTRELCKAMIRENLGLRWSAFIHPDPRSLSPEICKLMREAGCAEVGLSVDSGSDKILAGMGKQHTVDDSVEVSQWFKQAGISVAHTYLFGWPGESLDTLAETVNFMRRTEPDFKLIFAGIRILPGTRIADVALQQGLVPEDADLLVPVFANPEQVLSEFLPYLRRETRGIENCILPSKGVDFSNLVMQAAYLRGYEGGYADFMDHITSLPLREKVAIGWDAAQRFLLKKQFIPSAR
ncbi:radical SAM protein [Pontiellaceae bacterium B1224]|nr:radical SAM protein [Pontiellaceae bacterium B1224]